MTSDRDELVEYEAAGKNAYNAYGDAADWKNYQGNPMPTWEQLPDNIRFYWRSAVRADLEFINNETSIETLLAILDVKLGVEEAFTPDDERYRHARIGLAGVTRLIVHGLEGRDDASSKG